MEELEDIEAATAALLADEESFFEDADAFDALVPDGDGVTDLTQFEYRTATNVTRSTTFGEAADLCRVPQGLSLAQSKVPDAGGRVLQPNRQTGGAGAAAGQGSTRLALGATTSGHAVVPVHATEFLGKSGASQNWTSPNKASHQGTPRHGFFAAPSADVTRVACVPEQDESEMLYDDLFSAF